MDFFYEKNSKIAFFSKELKQWDPIVFANRAAEQLVFPLDREDTMKVETGAEKAQSFKVHIRDSQVTKNDNSCPEILIC